MVLILASLFAASSAIAAPAPGEPIVNLAKPNIDKNFSKVCFKKTFKLGEDLDTLIPGKSAKYKCYVRRGDDRLRSIGPCDDPTYLPADTGNAEMNAKERERIEPSLPADVRAKIEAAREKNIEAARVAANEGAPAARAKAERETEAKFTKDAKGRPLTAHQKKEIRLAGEDAAIIIVRDAVQAAREKFDSTYKAEDYGFKPRDYSKETSFEDFKFESRPGHSFPEFKESTRQYLSSGDVANCRQKPKSKKCKDVTIELGTPSRKIGRDELADYWKNRFTSDKWRGVHFVKRPTVSDTEAEIAGTPDIAFRSVPLNQEIIPLTSSHGSASAFICYSKKAKVDVRDMTIEDFVAATGGLLTLGARPEPVPPAKPGMQDRRDRKKPKSDVQAQ